MDILLSKDIQVMVRRSSQRNGGIGATLEACDELRIVTGGWVIIILHSLRRLNNSWDFNVQESRVLGRSPTVYSAVFEGVPHKADLAKFLVLEADFIHLVIKYSVL